MFHSEAKLVDTKVDYWPSLVDALTSVFMIVVLITILQRVLTVDIETAEVRNRLMGILNKRIQEEGLQGRVTVIPGPNLLQIRFSDKVLFKSGRYELSEEDGKRALKLCAEVLTNSRNQKYSQIQVEGYADNVRLTARTFPADNWELSVARAVTVLQELRKLGVPDRFLSANGYGEQRSIATNRTEEGRALNRRIELRIVFTTPGRNHGG